MFLACTTRVHHKVLQEGLFQVISDDVQKIFRKLLLSKLLLLLETKKAPGFSPEASNLVEAAVQGTNTCYVIDFIEFMAKPYSQPPGFYRDLYLTGGLSAAQIAEKVGCSKTTVLDQLRKQGIRISSGRRTNPDNYRLQDPPFGFSKKEGRLVPNKAEMRICRIIVELGERQDLSLAAIGRELESRNIKNRNGVISWSHGTIGKILRRWKGKI